MNDRKEKLKLQYVHIDTLRRYFSNCFEKIIEDAYDILPPHLWHPTEKKFSEQHPTPSTIAQGAEKEIIRLAAEYTQRTAIGLQVINNVIPYAAIIQAAIEVDRREREKEK